MEKLESLKEEKFTNFKKDEVSKMNLITGGVVACEWTTVITCTGNWLIGRDTKESVKCDAPKPTDKPDQSVIVVA